MWGVSFGAGIDWGALRGSGAAGTRSLLSGRGAGRVIVRVSPTANPEVIVREASRFKQGGSVAAFAFDPHWSASLRLGVGVIDDGSTLAVLPAHSPQRRSLPSPPLFLSGIAYRLSTSVVCQYCPVLTAHSEHGEQIPFLYVLVVLAQNQSAERWHRNTQISIRFACKAVKATSQSDRVSFK